MFKDTFFWFSQPSVFLTRFDHWVGYLFLGVLAAGIVLWLAKRFVKHPVVAGLLGRLRTLVLTVAAFGLFWFGLRYENTPIFARRFWLVLIALMALVWLAFLVKYFFGRFRTEKKEYDFNLINSKYVINRKK